MDLSVITVPWNNEELIADQITSVFSACDQISCEQIISDNDSKDNTVHVARDIAKKLNIPVQVIENGKNLGFAAGNNVGLAQANGEFLLFLNADMRLEKGSLDKALEWMKRHQNVGLMSVKLVDEHGKLNEDAKPRRLPKVWEQVALILKLPHLFPGIMNKYLMKDFNPDVEQEVDSVRGSFMLMRREVTDHLGWAFDPRYFIWYEDVDICREVKKMGYKVMYTPIIMAVDYVGQSFKKRTTLWKQKEFTKSMLIYFQKWEPFYKWFWIWLFKPVGIVLVWFNDLLRR